jgi:tetratricopeptide (TPR) repeat protein
MTEPDIELDTAIDESGLLPHDIVDEAAATARRLCRAKQEADWLEDIRTEYLGARDDGRLAFAVALVHAAVKHARAPETQFDLLNLQGLALTAMIEAGGPADLHDFRMTAFETALLVLHGDASWTYRGKLCRKELVRAWLAGGQLRRNAEYLRGAYDECAVLLPAFQDGRLGFATHAKAAEIAALQAQIDTALAELGEDADPLPLWRHAIVLALDPALRAADPLGNWDPAMEILEEWLEYLRDKPGATEARAVAREALQSLNLPPDNPDRAWVQYFIGALALTAGLQPDGMRMEAKDDAHEQELIASIAAYRTALAEIEAGRGEGWTSTVFHLAYAIHSLSEARRYSAGLGEAIGLYERAGERLRDCSDSDSSLELAQTQMNQSEAMALKGEIDGDVNLARRGLDIANQAHDAFVRHNHDEGIEVAAANCRRIRATIKALEKK